MYTSIQVCINQREEEKKMRETEKEDREKYKEKVHEEKDNREREHTKKGILSDRHMLFDTRTI